MADQVTFRDFAGALMQGDEEKARGVLATLLALEPPAASAATSHFREQMAADPSFVAKAMGMRTAVEARDAAQLEGLLRDCFGLGPAEASAAASVVLARLAGALSASPRRPTRALSPARSPRSAPPAAP